MQERPPSRRKVVAAALIAVAVSMASLAAGWYLYLRPLSVDEVFERAHWSPGETRDVEGTITGVWRHNTSYGPTTFVNLRNEFDLCPRGVALGDPTASYRVGDRFRTTLHFTRYSINGDPAVWAPEIVCPFPALWSSLGVVVDAMAYVGGFILAFRGTDADRWTTYEVVTGANQSFPADRMNVSLRKDLPVLDQLRDEIPAIDSAAAWVVVAGLEYVRSTGRYSTEPEVDRLAPLVRGASDNGTLRYVDANGNGLVDDGDAFQARLDSVASATTFQTYILTVGMDGVDGPVSQKYILNGFQGPYERLEWP